VTRATHALSWQRVAAAVTAGGRRSRRTLELPAVFGLGLAHRRRAALGIERAGPRRSDPRTRPAAGEQTLQYWEPFESDVGEAPSRRGARHLSYVPRDNLANIQGRREGRRPKSNGCASKAAVVRARHGVAALSRTPSRARVGSNAVGLVVRHRRRRCIPCEGLRCLRRRVLVMDSDAFRLSNVFLMMRLFHMVRTTPCDGYPATSRRGPR